MFFFFCRGWCNVFLQRMMWCFIFYFFCRGWCDVLFIFFLQRMMFFLNNCFFSLRLMFHYNSWWYFFIAKAYVFFFFFFCYGWCLFIAAYRTNIDGNNLIRLLLCSHQASNALPLSLRHCKYQKICIFLLLAQSKSRVS